MVKFQYMSKGKRSQKQSKSRKKSSTWQMVVALLVVAGLASSWFLMSRDASPSPEAGTGTAAPTSTEPLSASLRNRMVLPAQPRQPRPVTLDPASFASNPDPEVYQAYKAAKDAPEVLEHMACYCGCFATAGHRNNLDCYRDNHGMT